LTWLSYAQYYANITKINNDLSKEDQKASRSEPPTVEPRTPGLKYELEYHTKEDGVYQMQDLTVRSYLDLAERIARVEMKEVSALKGGGKDEEETRKKHKNRVWHHFVKRAFVSTKLDEEVEDEFG